MEMDLNCSPLHSLRANYHKAHLTKVRQTVSCLSETASLLMEDTFYVLYVTVLESKIWLR